MSKAEDALRDHQGQLDPEGIMVSVSRQAVGEVLKELAELRERVEKAEKELEDYRRECKVLKVNNDFLKYWLSSAEMERDELVVLVPKLKGFLSVERNKVEGWVEKCAEKDKRIGVLENEMQSWIDSDMVRNGVKNSLRDVLQATQPKPTTPSVPSEGEG